MMVLLKEENNFTVIDLAVDIDINIFMIAIKSIRNAEARNDLWRFRAAVRKLF